ncbi:23S rRNA (pseudouridine(1915)-N(3))-methyltransferase [hydrothermal vent metagenome]|uniref:23S rRNA (Pseudouridine(1915)-N(3))-methyltransferase n=1 Tax=hydrothermal vent metagenome TaxID=652676 RepID=A0A3B0V864_9ZZZZ
MPQWVQQTYADYNNRLGKNQQPELVEIAPVHRTKTMSMETAKHTEGKSIISALKPNEKIILLDEHGQSISTRFLAQSIQDWQMNATNIAIIIGGADGVSDNIKHKAHSTWSLSQLTFPHPLVRVIIMEQIYRAYSLIAKHPYHRESS